MGVQGTDTKDPYSNAIGDHVRALYESCFCYHYPRSPVYVKLQQPIQEIEDIHIDLVFPKDFKTLRWYFSKSTDKDHEWNAMELKNFGDGIIACFSNNFKGEEDKYSWHNSDVGNAVPVFKQGMEHFVRLHYDKKTSELVTSVNGREYNRHEMPEGADANEFTLYGDVYVTDLIVPYKSLATPLKVDLIGAVLYDDKYSIIFDTTHNSKMVTLSFGDMRLEVDLEKEKEHLQDRRNDLEVTSYSNCAFLTLNRKILEQVSRRLVTDHMLITGDIKIHKIEISKG